MTHTEIASMISEIGVPFAYYQFPDGTGQEPPFICFYYPQDNDFLADDSNYYKISLLTVELYTDTKDFAMEQACESVFSAHGLVYSRVETWIDSERMNMVTYTMEVLING